MKGPASIYDEWVNNVASSIAIMTIWIYPRIQDIISLRGYDESEQAKIERCTEDIRRKNSVVLFRFSRENGNIMIWYDMKKSFIGKPKKPDLNSMMIRSLKR